MGVLANCRCVTFGCMVGFCLLLGGVGGTTTVTATAGQDVTLPCSYDAVYYGRLALCWGRGPIPNSGCNSEVLKADSRSVVSRQSERYRLMGDLNRGDVSLTILQVQLSESGIYGCRVDIPGWFNDHKHETTLSVVAGRPHPAKLEAREVTEKTITIRWTPGPDGGSSITGYRINIKNKTSSWDTATMVKIMNPLQPQVTLIDMRPHSSYDIRMFAVNSEGLSEASNVVTVTTREAAPSGPPLDGQLEALTPRSIKVTWKPPKMELRNGVLRDYKISYSEYDSASRRFNEWYYQRVRGTGGLESTVLNNLRPATQYIVEIRASTMAGMGPAFSAPLFSTLAEVLTTSTEQPTTAATTFEPTATTFSPVPPDPPVLELLEVNDMMVSFRWTAGFDRGVPISSYYMEYKVENTSWDATQRFVVYSPNQTEAAIIETHPSTYNIRLFALSSLGTSPASNVLTFVITEKVLTTSTEQPTPAATTFEPTATTFSPVPPDPPVLELLEVNDMMVSFHWTAGFDRGVPISSYYMEYKVENTSWDATQGFGVDSPNQTEATIIETHPSTYNIRMFARSSLGTSPASNVLTFVITEKGQQIDPLSTPTPIGTQVVVRAEDLHGDKVHPAVVAVPVLIIVAAIALGVTWRIRRMISKNGFLGISMSSKGTERLTSAEAIAEL